MKILNHAFLTDGGSVYASIQLDSGVQYDCFADYSVEADENGSLSIVDRGHSLSDSEFHTFIAGLHEMLKDDLRRSLNQDEVAVLEKLLEAAGETVVPVTDLSTDHAILAEEDWEGFADLLGESKEDPKESL
jgi:hypothetical protein